MHVGSKEKTLFLNETKPNIAFINMFFFPNGVSCRGKVFL